MTHSDINTTLQALRDKMNNDEAFISFLKQAVAELMTGTMKPESIAKVITNQLNTPKK